MEDSINLIIRVMPANEEHDVELSRYTTGKEILNALIDNDIIKSSSADGDPYIYRIVTKGTNVQLTDEKALEDVHVKDGDTLIITPELVAGSE